MLLEVTRGLAKRLAEACIIKSVQGALARRENNLRSEQKIGKNPKLRRLVLGTLVLGYKL